MIRIASALVVSLLAAPAAADTSCTNGIDSISGAAGAVLACSGATCLSFANGTATAVSQAAPRPPAAERAIRKDAKGKLQACGVATCKPAGPLLAAAAEKATSAVTVSDDAAVAVVDVDLWDVAADAKVSIAKPPKPPSSDPLPVVAGHVVVAAWRSCENDINCGEKFAVDTIVDAHGKQIGKPFPDGRLVIIDAHHAAVIGHAHKLTAFDTDTGAQLGTISVIPSGTLVGLAVGKLDDGSVGVAWSPVGATSWTLALIKAPAGKAPSVAWTRKVAICPP
jgi:hypothetical protein